MAEQDFSITNMKQRVQGYARGYAFYMYFTNLPTGVSFQMIQPGAETKEKFYVRSTNLPGSTLNEIITNWQGNDFKQAGPQEFDDWTVSFNCDVNALLRKDFVNWVHMIHNVESNIHAMPVDYYSEARVELLDVSTGKPTMAYNLKDLWPSQVGELDLDYGNKTDVAQFDVTFKMNYHNIDS